MLYYNIYYNCVRRQKDSLFALFFQFDVKGTDQAGTFMSLKCVVYYANYRSWHHSSKI